MLALALLGMCVSTAWAEAGTGTTSLADGIYAIDVTMEGGSGRASIDSPATVVVQDGGATATIVWSSPNYDYMLVDGQRYLPTNTEGNSSFDIPVPTFDEPFEVVGDTTAMSKPHEITYELTFVTASARAQRQGPTIPVPLLACGALALCALAFVLIRRRRLLGEGR